MAGVIWQPPTIITVAAAQVNIWQPFWNFGTNAPNKPPLGACRLFIQLRGNNGEVGAPKNGRLCLAPLNQPDFTNPNLAPGIVLDATAPVAGPTYPVPFVDEEGIHVGELWWLADTTGMVFSWMVAIKAP